jgi:hypothetical protein
LLLRDFSMFDVDRNQSLSTAEISSALDVRFQHADLNRNGRLSIEEATRGMPMVANNFSKITQNGADEVTLAQVRAFFLSIVNGWSGKPRPH